jgi:Ethanolamine utilization protein EutJ (predicted chaperonin)
MCGALRASTRYVIPTKNHLGEKCINAPSPLKVPVAVASVLALVRRAGRDVGGAITGFAAHSQCPLYAPQEVVARCW